MWLLFVTFWALVWSHLVVQVHDTLVSPRLCGSPPLLLLSTFTSWALEGVLTIPNQPRHIDHLWHWWMKNYPKWRAFHWRVYKQNNLVELVCGKLSAILVILGKMSVILLRTSEHTFSYYVSQACLEKQFVKVCYYDSQATTWI